MRSKSLWPRALGLSVLAALGMMTFTVASAQAESLPGLTTPGEFQINLNAALLATFHAQQIEGSRFLVPGRNLTIDCEKGLSTNGKIVHLADASATILFEKCVPWNLELTETLPCTVLSSGEPEGSISLTALGFPNLHGTGEYVLFEPPEGVASFVTVEFHGAECPLPLTNPVKGSISAEALLSDTVKPLLVFSGAIQELTGDKLTFGGFPAAIDAIFQAELTGAHAGMKLGVV